MSVSRRMRLVVGFLLLAVSCGAAQGDAASVASPGASRPCVLLIHWNDHLLPASRQFDDGFREGLGANVDVLTEFIDADRFSNPGQEEEMANHLRVRWSVRRPGAIVTVGGPSLGFVRKYIGTALPAVPVVAGALGTGSLGGVPAPREYGVPFAVAMRPTLELMLRMHPGLKEVVVITGASLADRGLGGRARTEFAPLAERVRLIWWDAPAMSELPARVRNLPPDSAIFFVSITQDGEGLSFVSSQVVAQLAALANVPVYGAISTYVGQGIVGGQVEPFYEQGETVGRITAGILQGNPPARTGIVEHARAVYQFDARALGRWGIDPQQLPPDSVVLFKEASPWDDFRPHLIFITAIIILLAALVLILLVNRQRLRRTERRLHERLWFEQLTSGISAALVNAAPERMDAEIESALEKVRVALQLDRCILFDFLPGTQIKRITHRAESKASVPLAAAMTVTQLPWVFRQLQEGRAVSLARAARDLPAEAAIERDFCAQQGICSVLIMPVRQGGQLIRWIGFYTAKREQAWAPELAARLHVIAETLVSALAGAQSEHALRQSEQLNRDILSSLNEQVALVDRTGTILSVNQAWYRFLREGCTDDPPVVGTNYLAACRRSAGAGDRDAGRVVEGLESVLNGTRRHFDMVYACEIPGLPAVRWFRMTVTPFNTPSGGAVVMHSDVTEAQRLHEALLQSEERYREVVESQTELVCRYRGDAVLTFVNEAYCRFFGRSRESLLGRSFLELIPEACHAQVRDQIAMLHRKRRPYTYEHEVTRSDGTTCWQQWVDYPILDERGEIEEFQAIGRDITDRKRAEEADRNLAHAGRLAVAGELTASIAHEINQPLGAILSNADAAEMLLERPHPPLDEIRQILTDIRRDDQRASDVIRHLRSLLRKHELEVQPIDLNEMITEVLRLAAADGQRRRVHFIRDFAAGLPPVPGDRVHLQQVVLNLLLNAMDAMADTPIPRRGATLRTRLAAEGAVEVSVSDTGHGIDPERMRHIFDSFFTTKKEGMGLGLSIARSIIEAHRGTLTVVNNAGGGATFSFTLPGMPGAKAEAEKS